MAHEMGDARQGLLTGSAHGRTQVVQHSIRPAELVRGLPETRDEILHVFTGDLPVPQEQPVSRLLDTQEHGRFRFRGPIQEPRHRTVPGQVLAEPGPGLPMQAAQVEEKFLLLVPERTERNVEGRLTVGQVLAEILQTPAPQIRLHAHMGDQIEGVTGPRSHDLGQSRRTAPRQTAVPRSWTHGFATLKAAMPQTDHRPADGLLHATARRGRRAGEPRRLLAGVKTETNIAGQLRGLLELFRGLLLDLVKQGGQVQFRRFFFSP